MRRMRNEMSGRERGRSDDDEEGTPALGRPRGAIVIACGGVFFFFGFLDGRFL